LPARVRLVSLAILERFIPILTGIGVEGARRANAHRLALHLLFTRRKKEDRCGACSCVLDA
jgi:hypothetical protein